MYQFEFAPERKADASAASFCPMCRDGDSRPVLTVKAAGHLPGDLDLVECAACRTLYFLGDEPVLGYDFAAFAKDYWYRYVQNGAGITAMLEPLLAIGGPRGQDLLDIGCGFGFVPDFWQKSGLGQGIGLETSPYGKSGREKLGVEIIASYYKDAKEIAGRKFDYVYSSEVLEHVKDPHGFIAEIGGALKPDGILVLTTPCADAVSPTTEIPTLAAVLSPGFHYFVTRPEALERLLRASGFPHVLVRKVEHRLLSWASRSPLPEIRDGFHDWKLYLAYLETLAGNPDPHVAGGALYRLLKDAINLGKPEIAERAFPRFDALAKSCYGIDFRDPKAPGKGAPGKGSAEFPAWLGCGYLFAGRYLELAGAPAAQLASLYAAAIEAMAAEIAGLPQFAQEAQHFLPMARAHLAAAMAEADANDAAPSDHPIEILGKMPEGFAGKEVCLFVTYVPNGRLLPGALAMIRSLLAAGQSVVVCCAVDDLAVRLDLSELDGAALIVKRRNGGYDFAVWAAVLAAMPALWSARRLFFVNDSILGPLEGFARTLQRIRRSDADFLALTESFEISHHSQSYFFVLQNRGLSSAAMRGFWRKVKVERTKTVVIEKYEVDLLRHARDVAGLATEILFSYQHLFPDIDCRAISAMNPTHYLWEHLLNSGFPFVKAELLFMNPLDLNIAHWPQIVALHGGDVDLFRKHIAMMERTRGSPALRKRYGKWKLLRRMLGDERFFELCGIWWAGRRLGR